MLLMNPLSELYTFLMAHQCPLEVLVALANCRTNRRFTSSSDHVLQIEQSNLSQLSPPHSIVRERFHYLSETWMLTLCSTKCRYHTLQLGRHRM
jgi:hypothetical protein